MIPFIRSLNELMAITKARDTHVGDYEVIGSHNIVEDSGQRKRYIKSEADKKLDLPNLPKIKKEKWITSKKIVSRLFDELDYNNQIPSSYELTLLESQNNYDQNEVA